MFQIEAVHLREINLPLAHPFETSFGVTTEPPHPIGRARERGARTAWGECVAGEHPLLQRRDDRHCVDHYCERAGASPARRRVGKRRHAAPKSSGKSVGTAWRRRPSRTPSGISTRSARTYSLAALLGGTRTSIACGVSIGIQPSLGRADREGRAPSWPPGYQRIKLKCKPGLGRRSLPGGAQALAGDPAELRCQLRLSHAGLRSHRGHGTSFNLLMIEQPLWYRRLLLPLHAAEAHQRPPSVSMSPFAIDAMPSPPSTATPAASSTSRSAGWAASARRSGCTTRLKSGGYLCGAGACWRPASGALTTSPSLRCPTSLFQATSPHPAVTGRRTSSLRR